MQGFVGNGKEAIFDIADFPHPAMPAHPLLRSLITKVSTAVSTGRLDVPAGVGGFERRFGFLSKPAQIPMNGQTKKGA